MDIDKIDQIIDEHQGEASSLIQVLLAIQSENRWLPKEALERVSEKLQVPLIRIQHIATFYKAFSLVPKGRHEIHICMGTACHVRGGLFLSETVGWKLGISIGQTTQDKQFDFQRATCLGCCTLGPVVQINQDIHSRVLVTELKEILENIGFEAVFYKRLTNGIAVIHLGYKPIASRLMP